MRSQRMNPAGLTLAIPCRASTHTACFNAKGHLGFPDHSRESWEREIAFEDLGGEPCGCRQLLINWRKSLDWVQKWKKALPPELFLFREDCVAERRRRFQAKREGDRLEQWRPHVPVYRRVRFLERLLNRLLTTRLGLPQRKWLSLPAEGLPD